MHKATAYFLVPSSCLQGRLIIDLLREFRGEVFPVDETAEAPESTIAFFFCDGSVRGPGKYGRRINLFRIGSDIDEFSAIGVERFPDSVRKSRIKVAVRRLSVHELDDPDVLVRLRDGVRQTLRVCTSRVRNAAQKKEGRFFRTQASVAA